MNIFSRYIAYLKDNPNGYWFKRKLYGWGWTPAKWQGWVVVLVFIIFVLYSGISLSSRPEPVDGELAWFFAKIILAVVLMISISYKTGERPRFQWGFRDENKKD
ncbi:MAG: hypothetical protein HQ402_02285 [Parcubacteria group bacterium]|nr:hypothetical protein [Parcubacteria group bacterium]